MHFKALTYISHLFRMYVTSVNNAYMRNSIRYACVCTAKVSCEELCHRYAYNSVFLSLLHACALNIRV